MFFFDIGPFELLIIATILFLFVALPIIILVVILVAIGSGTSRRDEQPRGNNQKK